MTTQLRFHFRLKPTRSMQDIDPPRIEAALAGLPAVHVKRIHDDRLSDASFVTLVIELRDPGPADLAALHRALTSLAGVRTYAVSVSGALTSLTGLAPERLPEFSFRAEGL